MKRVPRTNSQYQLRSRGGTGSTQRQPQPLQPLSRSVILVGSLQDRGTSTLWKLNTVRIPSPRISLRPPSSSIAIYVTTFQGAQLKSPSIMEGMIPFC
eukprot:1150059-Pelagomonas_calceolata.AAC.2